MDNLKVVILLASRNRPALIKDTIDSIRSQTYKNWECYITDDRSSPEVLDQIKNYVKDDERFSVYSKPNNYAASLSGNRNFGLDLIRTKNYQCIQFFDDDDLMHPKKLELQLEPIFKNPNLNFTVCKFDKLIIKKGIEKIIQPKFNLKHTHLGDAILTGQMIINSLSPLWNAKIFEDFRFDERLSYAEEWELFTRIGYHYPANYEVIDEYLFTYRKHPGTLTLGNSNIEKLKSSKVCRYLLVDYLNQHKLHTERSIKFFFKTFLLLDFESEKLEQLIVEAKNIRMSSRSLFLLKISINIHSILYKVIGKLINLS